MCIITLSTAASAAAAAIAIGVSLTAAAVSTTLGVIGANQQSKAQQAQYEYQAKVQERNEKIARNNASMERQTGIEEARKQRMKTLQAIGAQETALASNGVDVSYGNSLDIIEDTAMLGELDALRIQYNSERTARNYETQARNFKSDAVLSRYAQANAKTAGNMNVLAAGISGIGKMASSIAGGMNSVKSALGTGASSLGAGLGSLGSSLALQSAINAQTGFNSLFNL